MDDKSWKIKSYKQGKFTVSIRGNLEDDRVDEGDFPEKEEKNQINKRK